MYFEYFADGKKMFFIGNVLFVVNMVDLRKIVLFWVCFVNEIEFLELVCKELGWVRDMYAYDFVVLVIGIEYEFLECLESFFMV